MMDSTYYVCECCDSTCLAPQFNRLVVKETGLLRSWKIEQLGISSKCTDEPIANKSVEELLPGKQIYSAKSRKQK